MCFPGLDYMGVVEKGSRQIVRGRERETVGGERKGKSRGLLYGRKNKLKSACYYKCASLD